MGLIGIYSWIPITNDPGPICTPKALPQSITYEKSIFLIAFFKIVNKLFALLLQLQCDMFIL